MEQEQNGQEQEAATPEQETATPEGLDRQAQEIRGESRGDINDEPDPRDPEQWRGMPKDGGGA